MKRASFILLALSFSFGFLLPISQAVARPPNIVIIFADDLGYGDLGCYGHPSIRTPNLDRMAAEGMRFTDFYVAACVCTPSRAALLTGRLPIRSGMAGSEGRRVLFTYSDGGLPTHEITIATALKSKNYATACVGKWHLGHKQQYLPTSHGFDSYFGLLFSNDMEPTPNQKLPPFATANLNPDPNWWNVSLTRNDKTLEQPTDPTVLTKRYTEESLKFIRDNKKKPFFLYFAHTYPHVPLFASKEFKGKSPRGIYGDAVEEIDWSVGQILETLRKGSTWEGGMREPAVAWWPKKIKAGSLTHELASSMDLFNTCLKLARVSIPKDRVIDGVDMSPILFDRRASRRDTIFYYRGADLYAARKGPFKAHFITRDGYTKEAPALHHPPLLYHLDNDPSERFNIAKDHPDVIANIQREVEKHRASLVPGKPQY